MAEIVLRPTRILGFASCAGAGALHAAMSEVRGPDLHIRYGAAVVVLFQAEPDVQPTGSDPGEPSASLQSVQRRLEAACAAGPFLPMDPDAACCPYGDVAALLEATGEQLGGILRRQGNRQQWDISLLWAPKAAVAQHRPEIAPAGSLGATAPAEAVANAQRAERDRREAALRTALQPAVLAFAERGAGCTNSQLAFSVLVAANSAAAIEAALDGLAAEYTSIDIRGPLPPLSFSAVRLTTTDRQAITRAWSVLGLPDRIDLATLHRYWRQGAAAAHPDPQQDLPITGATVSELTAAYRLLRDLLANDGPRTMDDLLRRSGTRLIMPTDPVEPVAATRLAAEPELAGLS